MGISKSKESYDVSSLQTKIEEENAYGSIRGEEESHYTQLRRGDNERDIDIINKGETRKNKIIRFGPEKRKSIPTRDRVPSNTPVNEADEEILKEIVDKVKSGGAVVVSKNESGEEESRCSIDENPVAPIEQLIEDFERKSREDSMRRRGSYLGQIYAENSDENKEESLKEEKKDPLEDTSYNNIALNGEENGKSEEQGNAVSLENESNSELQTTNISAKAGKDPLEEDNEPKAAAPQRRVSYKDKAEFFVEDVPRKDSIETQPLGHRQSIKENLIEEFNSNLHGIEANRTDFVQSMLQQPRNSVPVVQETSKKDPLDADENVDVTSRKKFQRKKSDPLDVAEKQVSNGQPKDSCFAEIQEIMNRDLDKVRPETPSFTYIEYETSSTTIASSSEYPLNVVDTQKAKCGYALEEEKQIPLNTIREIKTDATKLRRTVEVFEGRKDDVQYVYLNEMLLRCLIKLDSVNVGEDDFLKRERKNVVDYVQDCIRLLDSRTEGDEPDIEVSF